MFESSVIGEVLQATQSANTLDTCKGFALWTPYKQLEKFKSLLVKKEWFLWQIEREKIDV